jgi:hypothetical protein
MKKTNKANTDASASKLLDNGWTVRLFKNQLGTYSAIGIHGRRRFITDHFTAGKAIQALADKVFDCGMYGAKQ